MVKIRLYDTTGRDKLKEALRNCKLIADLGCNEEKIRGDAIGYDIDEEVNPDYVCDFNSDKFEFHDKYDGICMSHILEHIIDTRTMLRETYGALRHKGKIAIIVPDGESVIPETLGDSDNTHEMLFTPITLKLYLENAGFKQVKTKYYDRPYAYKQAKGIFAEGTK